MQFLYEKDIIIIAEEIGRNTQPILNFNIHTKKQYSSEESEEIKRKIYDLQKQTENLFYLSA
ncbi:MAG: hypothetical protein HAW67_04090 [Endozoicomonadaceae bacterium]|nr:hypothetical protein [Endozoicomonadaceae bacterium]